ncbi:60Kd inner membrane protein-domain-containing protein [Aspergillus avenaceus]|uniref:60Kd inner membrane protein-domain-containing protein n=1 Tax=Aspergillus avenaceus TaxID=36643 RepID=A0A5N6TPV7_ASPAV|nr:60Kd inner membrane protein-domain-containing protein [Aspergillus avenaceus]
MRPLRPSLRLPIRSTAQQIRHFHPTRPALFTTELLDASASLIYGVHSISSLPWALSIPLTAVIVRTVVAMPLQIYTKVQARKERALVPVLSAWDKVYRGEVTLRNRKGEDVQLEGAAKATRRVMIQVRRKRLELYKRWKIPWYWKPMSLLQIPIWISVMDSIRAMSGSKNGFIPWLLSWFEPGSASAPLVSVEPSLATEGMLWFPDLLAGDPTGILPAVLSLSIVLNIQNGWKGPGFPQLADLPTPELTRKLTFKVLQVGLQVLACQIGYSAYITETPTALLLYWITSSNVATLQTAYLESAMFSDRRLKPWKRLSIGYDVDRVAAALKRNRNS